MPNFTTDYKTTPTTGAIDRLHNNRIHGRPGRPKRFVNLVKQDLGKAS